MLTFLVVSTVALWAVVLVLAFLLLGSLRAFGVLNWKLEELEATTPNRVGRSGLKPGKIAPEFTLPRVGGGEKSLRDFAGRPVLLVFVQAGCGPCHDIVPELNNLARAGMQVVAVNNAESDVAREWAEEVKARFTVLIQERWRVSRSFEVYATPYAFLIDAEGVIRSAGIAGTRKHLEYVLTGAGNRSMPHLGEPEPKRPENGRTLDSISSKEVSHV